VEAKSEGLNAFRARMAFLIAQGMSPGKTPLSGHSFLEHWKMQPPISPAASSSNRQYFQEVLPVLSGSPDRRRA
jgi:hypothetical protein